VTIVPHAPVQDVIRTMAQEHIDGVLVVEHGQVVGVCTARDIVARLAEQPTALDQLAVSDCMRPRPECLKLDTEIAYALHHMHINHDQLVPLVDEHEQPTGVVTLRDIIGHLVSLFPQEILNLPSSPEDMLPSKPEGA
jgi:CBS domain-containing protein